MKPGPLNFDFVRAKIEAGEQHEKHTNELADLLGRVREEEGGASGQKAHAKEFTSICVTVRSVPDLLMRVREAKAKPSERRRILAVLRALLAYWQEEEHALLDSSLGLLGLFDEVIATLDLIERLNDWHAEQTGRPLLKDKTVPSRAKLRAVLTPECNRRLDGINQAIWKGEDFRLVNSPPLHIAQLIHQPVSAPASVFRGSPPAASKPAAAREAPRLYDVWFATNRKPVAAGDAAQGFGGERDPNGMVHYGTCTVEIPRHHDFGSVGTTWWKRWLKLKFTDDRLKVVRRVPLADADTFFEELRAEIAALAENQRQILLYLHGFNVSFDEAAIRAAQIGFDLQVPGVTAFFSWPSKASVDGYFADADRIGASESDIAAFLTRLATDAGGAVVHIIAHSMGNRGLARAIQRITATPGAAGIRFGQIILAAPDLEVKLFRDLAAIYPKMSQRTTMYVSARDRALGISKWLQDSDRAGFAPPVTVVQGIDTIEVTNIDVTMLGHGYYAEAEPLLYDINELLRYNGPPPRIRLESSAADVGASPYWVIRH